MMFECNRGPEAKLDRVTWLKKTWRPWFAWRPVPVEGRKCAWLEMVERISPFAWYAPSSNVIYDANQYRYRIPQANRSGVTK